MKTKVTLILLLFLFKVYAQEFKATTEIQSQFIDITGLFGVDEPASITQFSYKNKGFGLDLYHSFSLENFGKTIQSIVTPSYTFKLDTIQKWFIKTKVEIANLETAGGGFVRPGLHLIYKPKQNKVLNFGSWTFNDFRDETKFPIRLNGITFMGSYTYSTKIKNWVLSEETRILYVDIKDNLKISGLFENIQFTYKPYQISVGSNLVYTFYKSDNNNEFFYNFFVSKSF